MLTFRVLNVFPKSRFNKDEKQVIVWNKIELIIVECTYRQSSNILGGVFCAGNPFKDGRRKLGG
jgi:hypothetical protein